MADNPRKKKADSKRRSQQKHEVAYQRRKARNGAGRMAKGLKSAGRKMERLLS